MIDPVTRMTPEEEAKYPALAQSRREKAARQAERNASDNLLVSQHGPIINRFSLPRSTTKR
jgi:hypothetical protein